MESKNSQIAVKANNLDLVDEIGLDEEIETTIQTIDKANILSPLRQDCRHFVSDQDRVLFRVSHASLLKRIREGKEPLSFELAGPRENIYFDPANVRAAIVTCGGLCPGINNVIRAVVMALYYGYGVRSITGIRYGLQGFIAKYGHSTIELEPETVERIHESGGTILASSRGPQPIDEIVDSLDRMNIGMLFLIGGDGTFRAGKRIADEVKKRSLKTAIITIPKTIDNDIYLVSKAFGFDTAVEMACQSIRCAHTEAVGCPNGIGLVKVMGRHSGFIAAAATNALREVNFCLIPESDFDLEGDNGLLKALEERLRNRDHAVVVVAEGAGQKYVTGHAKEQDISGNIKLGDIGIYLRDSFRQYFEQIEMTSFVRYIDPSYIIRSVPANVDDSLYCANLGQNAVHAAMAGKTSMMVSFWNDKYVHVPIVSAIKRSKKVNLNSRFWFSVLECTGQYSLKN